MERSKIPKDKRQMCVERKFGALVKCGETNKGRSPIYKCSYCKRVTLALDSKCWPLDGDVTKKKKRSK